MLDLSEGGTVSLNAMPSYTEPRRETWRMPVSYHFENMTNSIVGGNLAVFLQHVESRRADLSDFLPVPGDISIVTVLKSFLEWDYGMIEFVFLFLNLGGRFG